MDFFGIAEAYAHQTEVLAMAQFDDERPDWYSDEQHDFADWLEALIEQEDGKH